VREAAKPRRGEHNRALHRQIATSAMCFSVPPWRVASERPKELHQVLQVMLAQAPERHGGVAALAVVALAVL